MLDFRTQLLQALQAADIHLPPGQIDQLTCHWELVEQANSSFNLTAIAAEEAAQKHYTDCLLALPALQKIAPLNSGVSAAEAKQMIDIGSGAGFPGLVLAVARPDLQVTLLEATGKKADFLQQAAHSLHLQNVCVCNSRAEEAGRSALRESFAIATARAVAALSTLLEYAFPLLRVGGYLLALKGANWQEELQDAENAFTLLHAELEHSLEVSLPNGDARALLLIRKNAATADKYPRRSGMPSKRPL